MQYVANNFSDDESLGEYIKEYDSNMYNKPVYDSKSNAWNCTSLNINIQNLYDLCSEYYRKYDSYGWVSWMIPGPKDNFVNSYIAYCDDEENNFNYIELEDYANICKKNFGFNTKPKSIGKSAFSYICDGATEAINTTLICQLNLIMVL